MNNREHDQLRLDMAVESALKWIDGMADNYEYVARNMRRRKEELKEAVRAAVTESETEVFGEPHDVLSLVINDGRSLDFNARTDLVVERAIELDFAVEQVRRTYA